MRREQPCRGPLRQPRLHQVGAERAFELARVDALVRPQLDRDVEAAGRLRDRQPMAAELDDVADFQPCRAALFAVDAYTRARRGN